MGSSRLILSVGALLLWLLSGAYFFNKYCCDSPMDSVEVNETDSNEIDKDVSFLEDSKMFNPSSFTLVQPLSQGMTQLIDEYLSGMESDENKSLKITARYGAKEKNTSLFPDLGLARANNMKNLFIQNKIDPKRITLESVKVESENGLENSNLAFTYLEASEGKSIEDFKEQFQHNPIILYFVTNSDKLNLNEANRASIFDLLRYVELDDSINVGVSGYTDNVGEYFNNVQVSQNRAEQVQKLLNENSLNLNRIIVRAFGPERALATNETPEGRAKNRRVEISVIKKSKK